MPTPESKRAACLALILLSLCVAPVHALTVLFIGGASTPTSGADDDVMSFLESRYGAANVSYQEDSDADAGDENGFDVLIISSTVSSGSVRGKFHDSAVPILNWESLITDNDQAGELGVTTRLNEQETDHSIRILAAHPITAGFAVGEIVQIVSGSESVFWSVSPESVAVTHLAEDDDTASNKFISILEEGETLMGGGVAAARRVIFGLKDGTFSNLTSDGGTLFGQAVDWAAAGSVAANPPTVINNAASGVSATSATIGGEVTDTGGVAPAVTLYWGDNDGGTTAANWDQSVDLGARSGTFFSAISGLVPGTSYYFRSFASNSGGEDWADSTAMFNTGAPPNAPTVINAPATAVTFTEADVNGEVTSTGGETPEVTIYFGDNDGGTVPGNWDDSASLGAQGGSFSSSLFFLNAGTTYHFRAFASNSGGQSWAPTSATFNTASFAPPVLTTAPVVDIGGTSAEIDGTVVSTGGEAPEVTLYWGTGDGGTDPLAWAASIDLGPQSAGFSTPLSGLTPATTYHVRAYGENGGGGAWSGASVQFTTSDVSELVITEFMAANDGGASNNPNGWWPISNQIAGTTDDWIEIHNSGAGTLSLAGWHLTDDAGNPTQWTFPPSTSLAAGQFLVVYASGNNALDAKGNLHTNFALAANGEYVALTRPSGTGASEFGSGGTSFPDQDNDVSYGLHPVTGVSVHFTRPTPGAPNDAGGVARVADTKFNPDRGYYQTAINVTITSATAGAIIYYTTDGMPPVERGGSPTATATEYVGPIFVRSTTPVRAAATLPGLQPSNIDTHTYVVLDIDGANVDGRDAAGLNNALLRQRQPQGYANLSAGDYLMDTEVTFSTAASAGHGGDSVAQALLQGMRDIPTISIAMDRTDFAGGNGIYTNSTNRGFAWERECSAEFIPATGDTRNDWGENCGLRVQGGASRNSSSSPKYALSLRFRAEYGAGKLREDLFPEGPVSEFNVLVLRAGYNNSWIHRDSGQRGRGSMIRDQWAREALLDMGHSDAGRGFMVHLFINGLYWGVHNLCERQDAAHYATYNGGDEELLDARNGSQYTDGNSTAWNAMRSTVSTRSWGRIQAVLDVDTFIDYQIVNRYGGNGDLKTNGNWRAAGGGPFPSGRPQEMAPWKLFSWDAERILEGPSSTTEPLDPMSIRSTLDAMAEYRVRFGDRLQKHFFNGGAMMPDACKARWMKFANSLDRAIIAESARWGDHRRGTPYSRNSEWLTEQTRLNNTYFPVRSANVLGRYTSQGFYPSVGAPQFLVNGRPQHGGEIPGGGTLNARAGSGTIYYTTDGSDPRLQGGGVSPTAVAYNANDGVVLNASGPVRARTRSGSNWSGLVEATFYLEPLATPGDLHVTEVNYHPRAAGAVEKTAAAALLVPRLVNNPEVFEFIEVGNHSGGAVNLDGVSFAAGVEFTFGNQVLAAGEFAVLVKDPEAFTIRYPGVPMAGTFVGNLNNDGERVALNVSGGDPVHDFTYNDAGDWPSRSDGIGSSLEVIDSAGDYNDPANWRASSEVDGSPGVAGSGPDGRIVINEVLTHTDFPLRDAIELHNVSGSAVDITGWVLSDSASFFSSFVIPGTTSIDDGEYLVYNEDDFNAPVQHAIASYSGTVAAAPAVVDSPAHGLVTGDLVTILAYGGVGGYNGSFEVTVVDSDSFSIETAYLDNHAIKGTWTPGRPFALDGAHGESVWLLETDGNGTPVKFVDTVSFDAAFQGETLGRWPDGGGRASLLSMNSDTLGDPNDGPQVGPVVISEVMYQPAGGSESLLEFVEICNTGSVTENLAHWRLRGGADLDFTSAHELSPGGTLVVVAFDPLAEPAIAAVFRATYGLDAGAPLVGPFTDGPLRDDAGSLRLQRPDQPPPLEPAFFPAVTEDEVNYLSEAPWPASAAGGGDSLQRVLLTGFGNFASSWHGAPANPGGKPLGYAAWRDSFFGPGMPAGSGPFDDFDLDGFLNLFEYALRMNPTIAQHGDRLPTIEVSGGELSLTFLKDTLLSGITYRVERSTDLQNWTTVPDVLVSTSGSLETRRASVAIAPFTTLFLRLVVEQ